MVMNQVLLNISKGTSCYLDQ